MSYSPSIDAAYARSANYVDRVLKGPILAILIARLTGVYPPRGKKGGD